MTRTDLDELRALAEQGDQDLACVAAAAALITHREDDAREARRIRDQAIRRIATELGPAETARRTGMTLANIAAIRRGADR